MYIYRYEVVGRQVEGLSHCYGHLIFCHLLFGREVKNPFNRRVLKEVERKMHVAEEGDRW